MPLPYIITVITGSLKENGPTTPQLQSHATILARKDTSQLEASLARQPVSRFIYSGVVWLTWYLPYPHEASSRYTHAGAKPESLLQRDDESIEEYEHRLQVNAKMRFHRSLRSS